jgi:hypothetical protein
MEQKIVLKKLTEQIIAKLNNTDCADEKKWLQQFLPLSEAEIQGLLNPAQANLGYFLAWFQSLQLPSTQSESPLAPKSHVSFKVCTQTRIEFFILRSELTVTGLARVYCKNIFRRNSYMKSVDFAVISGLRNTLSLLITFICDEVSGWDMVHLAAR